MGFLRRLFGPKKPTNFPDSANDHKKKKNKKKWSFIKSVNDDDSETRSDIIPGQPNLLLASRSTHAESLDANKHAIAVADVTADVAEAAHAPAEVVRLTSGGGTAHVWELAAVKVQSAFRGYLARRALRALKALVKLQALVRGNIVRKQTADMLRRMQTLVRVQARARASRSHSVESLNSITNSFISRLPVPTTPDQNEHQLRAQSRKFDRASILKRCGSNSNYRDGIDMDKLTNGSNWLGRRMEENLSNDRRIPSFRKVPDEDDKTDKILEVDTWKPHLKMSQQSNRISKTSKHGSASTDKNNPYGFMTFDSTSKYSIKAAPNPTSSIYSGDTVCYSNHPIIRNEGAFKTAENSPRVHSASSMPVSGVRKGPFTPTRSEYPWDFFNGCSGFPNYMANTESSRAKVRSQSVPRQRLEFDKNGFAQISYHSDGVLSHESDLKNKAHSINGRLSRFGSTKKR